MMGTMKGGQLWILCLLCSCFNCKRPVQIVQHPAITTSECSTWGNFHFQTFDHVKFNFPGTCRYNFASHCNENHQDFNIHIKRDIKNASALSFTATIDGVFLEVNESAKAVNGKKIRLPFSLKSVLIEDISAYLRVTSKLGLTLKWNWADTLLLDLEDTYKKKTCGLCGNYDGNGKNDLISNGNSLRPSQFGNLQKVEDPTQKCADVLEEDRRKHQGNSQQQNKCKNRYKSQCKKVLSHFGNCPKVIDTDDYVGICVEDMCICPKKSSHSDLVASCVCSTFSQYSRDCVLKGGDPGKWRSKDFCSCYPKCSAEKPYYDERKGECVAELECTSCDPKENLCLKDSSGPVTMVKPQGQEIKPPVPRAEDEKNFLCDLECKENLCVLRETPQIQSPHLLSTTKRAMTITPCFCNTNGGQIAKGNRLLVAPDIPGWCIYAFCNASCQIDFIYGECSNAFTTSNLSMISSSPCKGNDQKCGKQPSPSSGAKPVPAFFWASDCSDLVPPRKFQEIWKFGRCQVATCLGGNNINISDVRCPPQKLKHCVNGLPLVKNHNPSHCCGSLECQCACSGWRNEHFITFDGSYYNFRGNCTYVLVKPIRPGSNNFWIHMDNHYCAANKKGVCSMSLFIFYNHATVTLTQGVENGKETNLVLFNNREIPPSFSNDGIDITNAGQYVVVRIPEIGLYVSYTLLAFHINLPFSTFYNNTEGQCGTCTNNKKDDAMKRNGEIISSFQKMAIDWKVMDLLARPCDPLPNLYLAAVSKFGPCNGPSQCHLIWTFTECHSSVPPRPYYDACLSDGCNTPREKTECKSLQMYAAMCGFHEICVDWRSKTNKTCALTCSQDKIYKPCGRMERPGCSSGQKAISATASQDHIPEGIFVEGCFCPDGKIQLNHHDSACVSFCGCTGPDGLLKKPGESWEKDCQICTCSKETLTISCSPRVCPMSPQITCTKEGFVPVVRPHPEDPCCMATVCECDVRSCTMATKKCSLGFESIRVTSEVECCPIYSCRPKGVCILNGLEYQPGLLVQSDSCEECICTGTRDLKTQTNQIKCTPIQCSTECQPGFHYFPEKGKCCGQCVQVACTAQFSSGIVTIKDGETYVDPQDKCTLYNCSKLSGQFILMSTVIACPAFDKGNCAPGTIKTIADGCCQTCLPMSQKCEVKPRKRIVVYKKCRSATPVLIPSCEGSCSTYSIYSFDTHKMKHKCTCCRATKYHEVRAELICSQRRRIKYTYLHVDECSCVETKCST